MNHGIQDAPMDAPLRAHIQVNIHELLLSVLRQAHGIKAARH